MPASSASRSIDELVERPVREQPDAEVEQLLAALRGAQPGRVWSCSRHASY